MNIVVFGLLGALLGAGFLGASANGLVLGAVLGVLVGWVSRLSKRVETLEAQASGVHAPEARASATAAPRSPPAARVDAAATPAASAAAPATPAATPAAASVSPATPAPTLARPPPTRPAPSPGAASAARRARRENLEPTLPDRVFDHVKRWFTTGNVPVKVGVVLSVFGVAFLIKEGIDRRWLVLPLEVRLMLVALFGIALLALGWRLRRKQRTYALSVQGGGIAVLYLTTYASFALYDLVPGVLAFALLIVITAAAGALAVLQDTRALAVLGIVGGFMAPVLTSSGTGNHVALFSYYAILNLAIIGIAWFKAWRELNVLGFFFTFGIGSLWGYRAYEPAQFASTEPFLILFVAMYTLLPVLFAHRVAPKLRGFVDGTLMFGTPVVGFALQSQLVADTQYGLALSAVALAAWYIGLATYLYRRRAPELTVLVESLLALSVAFVTVAVPLALDARWTSAAWALQGAAMVWLGTRQRRKLALAAGVALQALAGAAYAVQPVDATAVLPIVNGYFLGAVLIAVAGWFASRLFERMEENVGGIAFLMSAALFAWASGWWLWAGFVEVNRHVAEDFELTAELLFAAATTILAMLASAAFNWRRLNVLGLVLWPMAVLASGIALLEQAHPFASYGWVGWLAVAGTMLVFLRAREEQFPSLDDVLHALGYWLLAVLLALETSWQVDRFADGTWPLAAVQGAVGALVLATLIARKWIAWPLAAHERTYVEACCGVTLAALTLLTLAANVLSPGDAAPLPYVPLLNPLELASAFVLLVLVRWWAAHAPFRRFEIPPQVFSAGGALLGLFFLTMMVARAVHHFAGVAFDPDSLAASGVLQTALSIVWGVTGLTAMVIGARTSARAIWLGGAALMSVVVVKLFLVELDNTGTLGRVVSFLGVGLLLLVVGYFAPVPPRADLDKRTA